MEKNRLQIVSNNFNGYSTYNKITNINVNIVSKKYCSKCLSVLGDDRVVDGDGNEFCDSSCRRDYYYENRREMDSILSEF